MDLTLHVALDGLDSGIKPVSRNIVKDNVKAGQRADVRDAVTHLSCANDADGANAGHAVRRLYCESTYAITRTEARESSLFAHAQGE
jgi:hypothetical protein